MYGTRHRISHPLASLIHLWHKAPNIYFVYLQQAFLTPQVQDKAPDIYIITSLSSTQAWDKTPNIYCHQQASRSAKGSTRYGLMHQTISPSISQTPPASSAIMSNPRNSKCPTLAWCCMKVLAASTRDRTSSNICGHKAGYSLGMLHGICATTVSCGGLKLWANVSEVSYVQRCSST